MALRVIRREAICDMWCFYRAYKFYGRTNNLNKAILVIAAEWPLIYYPTEIIG